MWRKSKDAASGQGHPLDAGVLQPGETPIGSSAALFPSGWYKRVAGFRSFRDFQGRDISAELPGWPSSKRPGEPPAKGSGKGRLLTLAWFVGSLLQFVYERLFGGSDAFVGPDDPKHREDYQVMSADPGTIAFGAPWQLDPGRNKVKHHVGLHMTDRRLLFTDPASGALLWEVARDEVEVVEFVGALCYLRFVDGSWIFINPDEDDSATASERDEDYAMLSDTIDVGRLHRFDSPSIRFTVALEAFPAAPAAESH